MNYMHTFRWLTLQRYNYFYCLVMSKEGTMRHVPNPDTSTKWEYDLFCNHV